MSKNIELPCRIGDMVWGIRGYYGHRHVKCGFVSEMYFNDEMQLVVAVKHINRGIVGKHVFLTREEAEAAVREMERQQ